MKDREVDTDLVALVVKEVLQQVGQQGTQQSSQQVAEAVQQAMQKIQGSQQEKSSMTETKQEEINTGEAHRAAIFSDKEMWSFNKKALVERSQDYDLALKSVQLAERQLELEEKLHDFAHKRKLDHVEAMAAQQANVFNTAINMEYAKFNAASSHPISPNDRDKGVKAK